MYIPYMTVAGYPRPLFLGDVGLPAGCPAFRAFERWEFYLSAPYVAAQLNSKEHFWRDVKTAAEFADVFDGEAAFFPQHLGDNAGSAKDKDVEQVLLFEFIRLYQFAQDLDRAGRLERG
jgi:hypothetical protein